ncbi:MAG TPA: YhjD/YihY/BrkB family envelope integrity protein [Steroidobacteraceae bacterium]
MSSPPLFRTLQLRFEYWLFDLPEEVGGRPLQLLLVPLRHLYALIRDFIRGDLGLRAMGLVYSSLFAIVPVVAVSFSVLKAFGYHRELEPVLFEFLRPLGSKGYELTEKVMAFVENAQTTLLGTVGFVFLIYTVIAMIRKVEDGLNFTWHVERPRSLAKRLSEYLVIMLIGPVVAVAAMVLLARIETSDAMARLSGLAASATGHVAGRSQFTPYLLIIGLFWFVYYYMPNTRVRWQSAFIGAVFGGTVWVAVGAVFARIVVYATHTAAIYAGFAIVLLFLIWLHLSWLVMLLGGQLSFYTQHPEHLRTGHGPIPTTAILRERIAMGAMYLLAERFLDGGPRWRVSDLADRMDVPASVLDSALSNLEDRGLVLTAEDDTVAPGKDLACITLADILDAVRHESPDPRRPEPHGVPVADAAALAADAAMRDSMSKTTLRDLVAGRKVNSD